MDCPGSAPAHPLLDPWSKAGLQNAIADAPASHGLEEMNDAAARAAALQGLVAEGGRGASPQPLAEAVVGCALDLVKAGNPRGALALLASSRDLANTTGDHDWVLRLELVRLRALGLLGEYRE